jgi:aspartyl-tRNA(Asn)/glutamyl-tRNA(Gln) amidotransferase subunit C
MQIERKELEYLADLAGLELSEAEKTNFAADLTKIVDYISQLQELDTTGVTPTYQVTGLENVWRDDQIKQHVSREELLELAPAVKNHAVEVPKVL